ncbi:PPE family protein [Mycobacterium cookii]|nr:PPE family protein [Mycobacterium cookii]
MDFAALPPEINSGRMYSGPGSEPMLAAAANWDRLSGELYSLAASQSSVISGLTGASWQGPASTSMAAAASTYLAWMNAAASQAEETAKQARAAAAAYEAAFAATVPPPIIAANRALLTMLVASNFLGINTPAIMATEADYAAMWGQDAAAMYGYAASSAAAATLTPFTLPKQNTNPAAMAAQSAVVTNSIGTSSGTSIETTIEQMLQQILANINKALEPDVINSGISAYATVPSIILSALASLSKGTAGSAASAADATVAALSDVGAGLTKVASTLGSVGAAQFGGAVSAGIGRAASVGALSVPSTWGTLTSAVSSAPQAITVGRVGAAEGVAGIPLPVGIAGAPASMAAGTGMHGRLTRSVEGTTLRTLMRPSMLPGPQYI